MNNNLYYWGNPVSDPNNGNMDPRANSMASDPNSGYKDPLVNIMTPAVQGTMQSCGKLSARNQLKGTVTKVTPGAVNGVVEVNIGCGNTITSVITMAAINDLGIQVGSPVTVIIKSSDVILMA